MRSSPACVLTAAFFFTPLSAFSQSTSTVKGLDLYRSRALTLAQVRQGVGSLLDSYLALRAEPKRSNRAAAARLKDQIEAKIRTLAPVAYVNLNYNEYVTSAERTAYVTFDIVDAADAGRRMPFYPAPTGHALDPEGLLATWQKYSDLGDSLARQGLWSTIERPQCSAFFCLWGARTPELAQLEQKLLAGATPNQRLLREVLAKEADPKKRAAAVFVLSHQKDGSAVIDAALGALRDPADEVRSAALQILADMAIYHQAFPMDIEKVIAALDYPTVVDRARAMAVIVGIAENPSYKPRVVERATPYLLGLLRLQQPSNHDLAYTLLATISQESYDRRDYTAWSSWVEAKSSSSTATVLGISTGDGR